MFKAPVSNGGKTLPADKFFDVKSFRTELRQLRRQRRHRVDLGRHGRVRRSKPDQTPLKISDGGGLFLLIQPTGSKLWRLAYRFAGKQKTLALGAYPATWLFERLFRISAVWPPGSRPGEAITCREIRKRVGGPGIADVAQLDE